MAKQAAQRTCCGVCTVKLDEQLDFRSVIDDLGGTQMTERRDGNVVVSENLGRKHAYALLPCGSRKRIEQLCPTP
jgi:hypothetical protein